MYWLIHICALHYYTIFYIPPWARLLSYFFKGLQDLAGLFQGERCEASPRPEWRRGVLLLHFSDALQHVVSWIPPRSLILFQTQLLLHLSKLCGGHCASGCIFSLWLWPFGCVLEFETAGFHIWLSDLIHVQNTSGGSSVGCHCHGRRRQSCHWCPVRCSQICSCVLFFDVKTVQQTWLQFEVPCIATCSRHAASCAEGPAVSR